MSKIRKRKWNHKRKGNKNKKNLEWQEKGINKLYCNSIQSLKRERKKSRKEEFNFKSKKSYMLKN